MRSYFILLALFLASQGVAQTVTVNGRQTWTDTKINMVRGQKITIKASGTVFANASVSGNPDGITHRPDWDVYCVLRKKPHAGLIMKIGNNAPVFVGKTYSGVSEFSGRLYLGINDTDVGNNKGEFLAVIEVSDNKIKVPGNKTWTETIITVQAGEKITLKASGTVFANATVSGSPAGIPNRPDWNVYCIVKDKPHAGLIAKTGNGKPVFVGVEQELIATESGKLFLGINDSDVGNNKGEFWVEVKVE